MLRVIPHFRKLIAGILMAFGIFWVPKDVQDLDQAADPWRKFVAMIDQNTALWLLVIALLFALGYSEGRIFLRDRQAARNLAKLNKWHEGKTRFTIREAGCFVAGVSPLDFETSAEAQAQANEMVYYAKQALIRPAEMTDKQYQLSRMRGVNHGFDLQGVNLDTFISRDELDRYIARDKTLLPIIDEINQS